MASNREKDLIISVKDPITALHYLWEEQKRRKTVYWKMKDGNLVDITKMSDSHLDNVVRMLGDDLDKRSFDEAMAEAAMGN